MNCRTLCRSYPRTDFTISRPADCTRVLLKPLYYHCINATCFGSQRTIFREHYWYIWAVKQTKWVTRCEIQRVSGTLGGVNHVAATWYITRCALSWIVHLVTHFVDLAVEIYQSCSLRMAFWGPKHVGVTYGVNKEKLIVIQYKPTKCTFVLFFFVSCSTH